MFKSQIYIIPKSKEIVGNHNSLLMIDMIGKKYISALIVSFVTLGFIDPSSAEVAAPPKQELVRLKKGLREIDYLLTNWETKTTYCNFGEFQRDLLDVKNKELLMKAAAKGGLLDYDKSDTMNIVCKKDPQIVRAFLGLTNDNPNLNKADILMRKSSTLELVDVDKIDEYIDAVDIFSRAVASADGLSYNARSDFSSTETFTKDTTTTQSSKTDYLEQTKKSVQEAKNALEIIVNILNI